MSEKIKKLKHLGVFKIEILEQEDGSFMTTAEGSNIMFNQIMLALNGVVKKLNSKLDKNEQKEQKQQ